MRRSQALEKVRYDPVLLCEGECAAPKRHLFARRQKLQTQNAGEMRQEIYICKDCWTERVYGQF